ncbi:MAG: polymorphic toxin-type HINT domain-containing protein [Planctomycetota bacterium]
MKRFLTRCAGWGVFLLFTGGMMAADALAVGNAPRSRANAESDLALWHSGHVRQDNRWVKFDELAKRSAKDERLAEYRQRREESAETLEGRLELARWCSHHQLHDQARAHLTEVLRLDPNHAEARRRLGHRRVGDVWMSREEIEQFRTQADRAAKDLKRWVPELKQVRYRLAQRSERKRQEARESLLAIRDPAAIPAMELVLVGAGDEAARLAVEALEKMPTNEASLALARLAVFSPADTVRYEAAKKLSDRNMDGYVPALLSSMSTPVESRAELDVTPRGRLIYRHVLYREGQYQAERAVFDTEYRDPILSEGTGGRVTPLDGTARLQERDAANRAARIQAAVTEQNADIDDLNRRVCDALATATGEHVLPAPENWWTWWNDVNESYLPGSKPVREVYNRQEAPTPSPPSMCECLIAGTLVWTDSGLAPIERIAVGDRVLSQNPHTGELAYKPVLRTTVRPPDRLVKLVFGGEALQSTGGHPFWVAGEGWIKARNLKPGSRLHTVDGTSEVWSVHPTGTEETYNLIVADFHTYFVGKTKILSHDNTIREPTDALVPGLVSR